MMCAVAETRKQIEAREEEDIKRARIDSTHEGREREQWARREQRKEDFTTGVWPRWKRRDTHTHTRKTVVEAGRKRVRGRRQPLVLTLRMVNTKNETTKQKKTENYLFKRADHFCARWRRWWRSKMNGGGRTKNDLMEGRTEWATTNTQRTSQK